MTSNTTMTLDKKLVLFDFDGTITTRDTFIEFIRFVSGAPKFYLGFMFLLPVLILYKLKLIKNWRAKEIVFAFFFKGMPEKTFQSYGDVYATAQLPKLIRPKALQKIEEHRAAGDEIYLVTASSAAWIQSWANTVGITILGTQWAVADGKITGRIDGINCYGIEKVNRIKRAIDLSKFGTIVAYGDTRGDREMLALAHESNYRAFH